MNVNREKSEQPLTDNETGSPVGSLQDDLPFSEAFDVSPALYEAVPVQALHLSVRPDNCLKNDGCFTVGSLLKKNVADLMSIRSMGQRSVNEIVAALRDFLAHAPALPDDDRGVLKPGAPLTDEKLKAAVEAILAGAEYTTDGFGENDLALLERVSVAVEILGRDLCDQAFRDPKSLSPVCRALHSYAQPILSSYAAAEAIWEKLRSLPGSLREQKALPFLKAYFAAKGVDPLFVFPRCDASTRIGQLAVDAARLALIDGFAAWLHADMSAWIREAIDGIRAIFKKDDGRNEAILTMRARGMTLQEAADLYGLTRERVRQIEAKTYRKFWVFYGQQKVDLILLVSALRNGDEILRYDELKASLGDFTELLWAAVKSEPIHTDHYYSKDLDAVVIRTSRDDASDDTLTARILRVLDGLPPLVEAARADDLLAESAAAHSLPVEAVRTMFFKAYRAYGKFYSREAITVSFMCLYVLKHSFPDGYKIGDPPEAKLFRNEMIRLFGSGVTATNRSVDTRVSEVGVLCDRGRYIHPDFLQVDEAVIEAVNQYIASSPRSVLTYGEILDALPDLFGGTQITNRYLLQGALKKYGCHFRTGRDYIRKTRNVSFVDELDSFMAERGIAHKTEIFGAFTSLNDVGLSQVVSRSSAVFSIDNGYYIHVSQFDIQPCDYEPIRQYLSEACAQTPVNIRTVYEEFPARFPGFMSRNDFDDRNKLFAALNYMFCDAFRFSRPYIARLGADDVTNKGVILRHIADYDSIEISELIDICEEKHINYVSMSILIELLSPEYLRIDADHLMKRELTGLTDFVTDEAVAFISEMLGGQDYVVGSKISDFSRLPLMEADWNVFLLESVVLQSGKINVVRLIGDPLNHPKAVYVSDRYQGDNFYSFLLGLLTEKVREGAFASKTEMRAWLREEGLIDGALPNFLESAKYFYVDSTGVHCTADQQSPA